MSGCWGSFAEQTSALLVGVGILTFALFPLALPMIALTAVALTPLLVVGLAAVVVAAPPLLIARWLGRRASERRARIATRARATAGTPSHSTAIGIVDRKIDQRPCHGQARPGSRATAAHCQELRWS